LVKTEDLSSYAPDLLGVREVDPVRRGDPCFPLVDPAVCAFPDDVTRCVHDQGYCFLGDGEKQGRLVAFRVHDVVEPAGCGEVGGGVALGVCCVHGDYHALAFSCRHWVQQGLDLGDFVGVRRDAYLGDGHAVVVDHRGEQGELVVVTGSDSSEDLAVDRDVECLSPS